LRVERWIVGRTAVAVPAQIGRDDAEAGRRDRFGDAGVEEVEPGVEQKAVQQQHGGAFADAMAGELDAIRRRYGMGFNTISHGAKMAPRGVTVYHHTATIGDRAMSDRVAQLQGVRNFRDFGGYRAGDGAVRRRLLFRSAHFAEATDADAAQLDGLGVRVIVDLRRPQERAFQPSRWPGGGDIAILADQEGPVDVGDPPHIAFLRQPDLSAEAVDRFMIELYQAFPFEGRHRRLYGDYFRALADGDGASVVHCAAGKDRTGLICALVLAELGVHQDDVLEDYLLTNTVGLVDGRAEQVRAMIEQHLGRSLDRDALLPMLGVRPAFLDAALTAIGDVDQYLEQALGIDADTRRRLKDRLIA